MSNNNEEAVTYIQFDPGDAGAGGVNLSYASLNLSSSLEDEDQITVVRKFDLTLVDDLVNSPPTGPEFETLYALGNEAGSGSTMYTLDTVNKKIVFSSTEADYIWKDVVHHDRGADLALPVVNYNSDTILIVRKTFAEYATIKWVTGAKVTSRALNAQNDQLLQLLQELRTKVINSTVFDYNIGASEGTCPLDANAVIPLARIPLELGGQGQLAVDLSDKELEDLQDVDVNDGYLATGHVLQWDADASPAGQWVNEIPMANTVDLDGASAMDVLRWDGSAWELEPLNIGDLGNITDTGVGEASILFFDSVDDMWKVGGQLYDDASFPVLTDDHILTWNTANNRWEARVHPFYTYEVFDLSEVSIFTMEDVGLFGDSTVDDINDTDILAWKAGEWQAKSIDTWDLNNCWYGDSSQGDSSSPFYSGNTQGPSMWQWMDNGWIMYWDKRLPQKDDTGLPNGAFHVGNIFSGSHDPWTGEDYVQLSTAKNHDVVKWKNENDKGPTGQQIPNHWETGKLNLNHLGDVEASYYLEPTDGPGTGDRTDPNDGDIIRWDETRDPPIWATFPGPTDVEDLPPGSSGQFMTNHELVRTGSPYDDGSTTPAAWSTIFTCPYKKINLRSYHLFASSNCQIMIKLYRMRYGGWNNNDPAWVRMDNAGELSGGSGDGVTGNYPVGWMTNWSMKRRRTAPNLLVSELNAPSNINQLEHMVIVLHFLEGQNGTPPTNINFQVQWDVLEF